MYYFVISNGLSDLNKTYIHALNIFKIKEDTLTKIVKEICRIENNPVTNNENPLNKN